MRSGIGVCVVVLVLLVEGQAQRSLRHRPMNMDRVFPFFFFRALTQGGTDVPIRETESERLPPLSHRAV